MRCQTALAELILLQPWKPLVGAAV